MKKLLVVLLCGANVTAFADSFNVNITNNSNLIISIKAAGAEVCSIPASSKQTCTLDTYTAYQATYPGKWAPQGLFTIQKYSYQVLQTTPVTANPALANFIIDVNGDNNYKGSVDNFQTSRGGFSSSGSCKTDNGGVTCQLSSGANLRNLDITLTSSYQPNQISKSGVLPWASSVD